MRRVNSIVILIFVVCIFCTCGSDTTSSSGNITTESGGRSGGGRRSEVSTEGESIFVTSESMDGIDGFKKAIYEDYNYPYSGRTKEGELLYVEGKVVDCVDYKSSIVFILEDEYRNGWLISVGSVPLFSKEKANTLVGKEIRVYGSYMGYSNVFRLPSMHILSEELKIEDLSDECTDIDMNYFKATREEVLAWFEENPNEILYSERYDESKADTYAMSTGIIDEVGKYMHRVDFFQKTESGYELQYQTIKDLYFKDETFDINELSVGDGFRIYFYIQSDNDILVLTYDKVEAAFTFEDIADDYKSGCAEYNYEAIARNPEKVKGEYAKLTGKVVWAYEEDKKVELHVNITHGEDGSYKHPVYVSYTRDSEEEDRILEDDLITIYGKLAGTENFTSTSGERSTMPKILAEYIDVNY